MIDGCKQLPGVFCERMQELLGKEAEDFFSSYQKEREYGLRYNPLKFESQQDFEKKVMWEPEWNLSSVPWCVEGYYYEPGEHPGRHPWHEAGAYYIQEPSAMSAVEMLDVQPKMKICDLCAAPGGKTTQIAGKMQGHGLLVSNEYFASRAKVLAQNVERMGIANTVVLNESTEYLAEKFAEFFDRILVDAPCSGEGMFRKDPQAVQEWSLENVCVCAERQQQILSHAAEMLKPGGVLVYSTCTFAAEENEQCIQHFLEHHAEFSLEPSEIGERYFSHGQDVCADLESGGTYRLWPHKLRGEGHFVARLRKAGNWNEETGGKHRRGMKKKETTEVAAAVSAFRDFQAQALRIDLEEKLSGRYVLFSDNLYLLPEGMPELSGLKVVRAGLHLGTCKKNRFEPSHALALYLHQDEAMQRVELSLEKEALKYLHGETVSCDSGQKGWTLVCVDGLSLGWGKVQNGIVKNHYPKGLRICY